MIIIIGAIPCCLFITGLLMTGFTKVVKTQPKQQWWFDVIDLTLYPIMKLFFHNKLTHKYHWREWAGKLDFEESLIIRFDGNKSLPTITNILQQIIAEFKGKGNILLSLNITDLIITNRYSKWWQLGFFYPETGLTKVCRVKIPFFQLEEEKSAVRCYVWGNPVIFFGIDSNGNYLPMVCYNYTDKSHHIPLL
ncbi:MAG: hypothetical protein WC575_03435 [Patescibacteria group bacterium]